MDDDFVQKWGVIDALKPPAKAEKEDTLSVYLKVLGAVVCINPSFLQYRSSPLHIHSLSVLRWTLFAVFLYFVVVVTQRTTMTNFLFAMKDFFAAKKLRQPLQSHIGEGVW